MRSLASFRLDDADRRRKIAAKFGKHMPADAAAAVTLLTGPSRQNNPTYPGPEPTPHEAGVPVLSRVRILLPLVEPNVLGWMRMISTLVRPRPSMDADGILTVTWSSPEERATNTRRAYEHYLAHHGSVREIGDANTSIDSWHNPYLLVPIRHQFADGSPQVTTWMSAEGTARVFGARLGLATSIREWAPEHPWTDPGAVWPADAVALRSLAAAARKHVEAQGGDPDHDHSLVYRWVEDWADIALPQPDLANQVESWAFRTHSSPRATPEDFSDSVRDYVEELDLFGGRDPYALFGEDPATQQGRAAISEWESEIRDWLLTPVRRPEEIAKRLAFLLVALTAVPTAPSRETAEQVMGDYARDLLSRTVVPGHQDPAFWVGIYRIFADTMPAPDLGDLHGVYVDLTSGYLSDPLRDPADPWFWLTSAQGLTYAALHGHLGSRTRPVGVDGADGAATGIGVEVLIGYAEDVQSGTIPADRFVAGSPTGD